MRSALRDDSDGGFGLVELVIAIFLLALITIALIPALYNGIRYSATQSTTATATRELNALVEQARRSPSCASPPLVSSTDPLMSAALGQDFTDGVGHTFHTSGWVLPVAASAAPVAPTPVPTGILTVGALCPSARLVQLHIDATDSTGTLATVDAMVYVP